MNKVHSSVIRHVRETINKEGGQLASSLRAMSDEQVMRMMFSNFRGREDSTRGMRLTNFGLEIMSHCFQCYVIPMPDGHRVQTGELLYLDKRAQLPYFFSDQKLVVFETELGIKLKLADGELRTLMEIEAA